jgi:beta-1,4-mannosyltransferase
MIERLYHYPFSVNFNHYARIQREMLSEICNDVQPVNRRALWVSGVSRRNSIAVLNWYEDKLGWNSKNQTKILVKAIFLLVLMRIRCAKIIWVRHNFWPHGLARESLRQRILLLFMRLLTTATITHRPVGDGPSHIVPHPLYFDGDLPASNRDNDYLYFGVISRYKGLDTLLAAWPKNHRLILAGDVREPELEARLNRLIQDRGLDVEIVSRFLPDEELEELLLRTRFVVLPHRDETAIVTGSFYHAASFGANILVRNGEFGRAVHEKFSFVTLFDDDHIEEALGRAKYVEAKDVVAEIREANGPASCREAWEAVLGAGAGSWRPPTPNRSSPTPPEKPARTHAA